MGMRTLMKSVCKSTSCFGTALVVAGMAGALGTSLGTAVLRAQGMPAPASQNPATQNGALDVLRVQGNVYLIAGAGGNIAVQVGPDGVVVVDTG